MFLVVAILLSQVDNLAPGRQVITEFESQVENSRFGHALFGPDNRVALICNDELRLVQLDQLDQLARSDVIYDLSVLRTRAGQGLGKTCWLVPSSDDEGFALVVREAGIVIFKHSIWQQLGRADPIVFRLSGIRTVRLSASRLLISTGLAATRFDKAALFQLKRDSVEPLAEIDTKFIGSRYYLNKQSQICFAIEAPPGFSARSARLMRLDFKKQEYSSVSRVPTPATIFGSYSGPKIPGDQISIVARPRPGLIAQRKGQAALIPMASLTGERQLRGFTWRGTGWSQNGKFVIAQVDANFAQIIDLDTLVQTRTVSLHGHTPPRSVESVVAISNDATRVIALEVHQEAEDGTSLHRWILYDHSESTEYENPGTR